MLGDPGGIVRLAGRAEDAADDVVRAQSRLQSAALGMQWKSTTASSFARRAEGGSVRLRGDVDGLEELAAALRAHARHVEEHLQVLADLARQAEQLAAQGVDAVGDAVGAAADAATGAAEDAADAAERAGSWVGAHTPW